MTRELRRRLLVIVTIVSASLATLFFLLGLHREPERPDDDPAALAAWLAERPADWLAASSLSARALDSDLPGRIALWRASYEVSRHLAPLRPNTDAGFVRGGLFHWYELGPEDRRRVLEVAARMMRDPKLFGALHKPLWELTRDFAYLRRVAPRDVGSLTALRDIAVLWGRFDDYRELRAAIRAERLRRFRAQRPTATLQELHVLLPEHLTAADAPFIQELLEEMNRRPFDASQAGARIDEVTRFAIEHDLQPLEALRPLVTTRERIDDVTRARLALALGDRNAATRVEVTTSVAGEPEWLPYFLERMAFETARGDAASAAVYRGRATAASHGQPWHDVCGTSEICTRAERLHEGPLRFTLEPSQSDEVAPYIEIHVDDALAFEGPLSETRTFTTGGPGVHRTEVRLVNRFTRAGVQRRVRLS